MDRLSTTTAPVNNRKWIVFYVKSGYHNFQEKENRLNANWFMMYMIWHYHLRKWQYQYNAMDECDW